MTSGRRLRRHQTAGLPDGFEKSALLEVGGTDNRKAIRIDDLVIASVRPALRLMDDPDAGGYLCPTRQA